MEKFKRVTESGANYSGMKYSYEYAEETGILPFHHSEEFGENHAVGVRENYEIRLDAEKGILCKPCGLGHRYRVYKKEFDTQLGIFRNDDRGEFGGSMITSAGIYISGNFKEVVNHKKKVYAVDSLTHMMVGNFRLLEFTDAKKYKEIYSTVNDLKHYFDWCRLSYGALFDTGDALYFVISGLVVIEKEYIAHTKLIKVQKSKAEEILAIDEEFSWINNLIVIENMAYVSMDKMIVSINLETGGLEYYTWLSELAERDLLTVLEKRQRKRGG